VSVGWELRLDPISSNYHSTNPLIHQPTASSSAGPSRSLPSSEAKGSGQAADRRERVALLLLQLGAIAVVLAALPYKTFDLDRFFVPKELILHVTAIGAALLCVVGRRRLSLTGADVLLVAFLGLSAASALVAQNWWLAGRALAMSISGVLLFWVGLTIRRAGLHRPLLIAIAIGGGVGARFRRK